MHSGLKLRDYNGNSVGELIESDADIKFEPGSNYVTLEMDTGNAAFEGDAFDYECARIMREAADRIREGQLDFKLRDVNGNTVGAVKELKGVEKSRPGGDGSAGPVEPREPGWYVVSGYDGKTLSGPYENEGDAQHEIDNDPKQAGGVTDLEEAQLVTKVVNERGLKEIKEFLADNHRLGGDHFTNDMLRAWAADAEFQMAEGNPPCIELRSFDCVHRRTMEYTISDDGIDSDNLGVDSNSGQAQSLYAELKAAGVSMDNHESDLYVPVNLQTTAILAKYPTQKSNARTFKSNIDGVLTYDIPFAYEPFWDKKQAVGRANRDNINSPTQNADAFKKYVGEVAVSKGVKVSEQEFGEVMGGRDLYPSSEVLEGKVVALNSKVGFVLQSKGRGEARVFMADTLSRIPTVGEMMKVSFKDGKGMVADIELGKNKGCER